MMVREFVSEVQPPRADRGHAKPPPFRGDIRDYDDAPGSYVLPSGPYKGKCLDQIPDEFLRLVSKKNWHPEVRELARRVIWQREHVQAADLEADGPPAVISITQLEVTRGRHKGKKLVECPPDYLLWLAENSESNVYRRAALEVLGLAEGIDGKPEDDTEPDPTSAAVALPGVTFRWWQAMLAEFGDDAAALEVVEKGLAKLKALCTEFTHKGWSSE
jgi:uncharacterized protein (DUF3820 family)